MTAADERLRTLFAYDEPPARDPAFSAELIERMARRRWLQDLGFLGGVSAIGAAVLWGVWPVAQPVLVMIASQLAPTALGFAVALSAVTVLSGPPSEVPAAES